MGCLVSLFLLGFEVLTDPFLTRLPISCVVGPAHVPRHQGPLEAAGISPQVYHSFITSSPPFFSFLFNFRYQVLKHNKLVGILNCLKRTEKEWIWRGGGGRFQAIIWIHNSCIRPTTNQNYINYKSIHNPSPYSYDLKVLFNRTILS